MQVTFLPTRIVERLSSNRINSITFLILIVNRISVGSRFIVNPKMKGGLFVMYEDDRILTVQDSLTPSYDKNKYSRILLQGKWLRDLGFTPGKKVLVRSTTLVSDESKVQLMISLID